MRQFNSAHLEIKRDFHEDFQTEPHEAGWAGECIYFIMVENVGGKDACMEGMVEISHDGISWAPEGTSIKGIKEKGLHFMKVREFGTWLRLSLRISGESPTFRLLIQIALKE